MPASASGRRHAELHQAARRAPGSSGKNGYSLQQPVDVRPVVPVDGDEPEPLPVHRRSAGRAGRSAGRRRQHQRRRPTSRRATSHGSTTARNGRQLAQPRDVTRRSAGRRRNVRRRDVVSSVAIRARTLGDRQQPWNSPSTAGWRRSRTRHWWYRSTRRLLQDLLDDRLPHGGRFLDLGARHRARRVRGWPSDGRLVAADFEPLRADAAPRASPGERGRRLRRPARSRSPTPRSTPCSASRCCATARSSRRSTVVGEMARVVRPGGVVCLWEPGVRRLRRAHDRVTHTGRRFSRRDLADLLTANGLRVERSTGAYSFLVPPAAAKIRHRAGRDVERPRSQRRRSRRHAGGDGGGRAPGAAPRRPAGRAVRRRRRPPRRDGQATRRSHSEPPGLARNCGSTRWKNGTW